jgi:hypothetical protein
MAYDGSCYERVLLRYEQTFHLLGDDGLGDFL